MRQILRVKPGITGIASLYLANEAELLTLFQNPDQAYVEIINPAKIELALVHVRHQSIWFDIKLLLLTFRVVVLGYQLPPNPIIEALYERAKNEYNSQSFDVRA
jgi:lipopolysaccharide/colanic/teichoic acid biosynthesis glycosyltransferase